MTLKTMQSSVSQTNRAQIERSSFPTKGLVNVEAESSHLRFVLCGTRRTGESISCTEPHYHVP